MHNLMGNTLTLPVVSGMPASDCEVIEEGPGYVLTRTCVPDGCRYEIALDKWDGEMGHAMTRLPYGAVFLGSDALNVEACGWARLMVWWAPPQN